MPTITELKARERKLTEQINRAMWAVTSAVAHGDQPAADYGKQIQARLEDELYEVENALAAAGVPLPDGP